MFLGILDNQLRVIPNSYARRADLDRVSWKFEALDYSHIKLSNLSHIYVDIFRPCTPFYIGFFGSQHSNECVLSPQYMNIHQGVCFGAGDSILFSEGALTFVNDFPLKFPLSDISVLDGDSPNCHGNWSITINRKSWWRWFWA
jgi:hypothetical protein